LQRNRNERTMKPTIISSKAGNWVDQGQPPHRVMRRVLSYFAGRHAPDDDAWLDHQANTIIAMVDADANEVEVANYLRSLVPDETGDVARDHARLAGIALWHIAKVALVRDFAERVLQSEVPVNAPTQDSFGHWVASRLLTDDELAEYESAASSNDEGEAAKPPQRREQGGHSASE
jgi:hypothetical protein